MKIDIFPHIFPRKFYDRILPVSTAGRYMQKRTRGIPVLVDLDLRLKIMDRYEGYVQVLTLASPPVAWTPMGEGRSAARLRMPCMSPTLHKPFAQRHPYLVLPFF
jgi:hypothetical protein